MTFSECRFSPEEEEGEINGIWEKGERSSSSRSHSLLTQSAAAGDPKPPFQRQMGV